MLSGALSESRRSAFGTSSSTAARRSTRRASTTLSSRPRPTAPAYMPTSRRHVSSAGCSPTTVRGATTGRATIPPGFGVSALARSTSRSQRRSSAPAADGPPAPARSEPVSRDPSGVTASSSSGSTSDDGPNGPHGSVGSGLRPVNPSPPRRTGPPPRPPVPASMCASATSARQASSAAAKRPGPSGSTAQARPIPTYADRSEGRSQRAASWSASRAAANTAIGSGAGTSAVAETRTVAVPAVVPSSIRCRRSASPSSRESDGRAPAGGRTAVIGAPRGTRDPRAGPAQARSAIPGHRRCAAGRRAAAGMRPRARRACRRAATGRRPR